MASDQFNNNKDMEGLFLNNNLRCLVLGASGSGKTNLMLNLLVDEKGISFSNVYLFSKTLEQPKYEMLKQILSNVPDIGFFTFSNSDDIMEPSEARKNSVIIFDDIQCSSQENIRKFFCMGRHSQIDSFYLAQSYSKIPKQLIRDNANVLILFPQDELNLKKIYRDQVSSDMSYETFKEACCECWKTKYNFLLINKDGAMHQGRYRKNFDEFMML